MDEDKTELFSFLSHHLLTKRGQGSDRPNVLLLFDVYWLGRTSCRAHTTKLRRICFCTVRKGYKKLFMYTVDTDVVVMAIATLGNIKPEELWRTRQHKG